MTFLNSFLKFAWKLLTVISWKLPTAIPLKLPTVIPHPGKSFLTLISSFNFGLIGELCDNNNNSIIVIKLE